MKKATVILVPAVLLVLVIAGVFLYRTGELNTQSAVQPAAALPNTYSGGNTKPGTGLGSMGTAGSTLTQGSQTSLQVSDLNQELGSTVDDGGTKDIQDLSNQAAGL